MRELCALWIMILAGCGGAASSGAAALRLRPACAEQEVWTGGRCVARADADAAVAEGQAALGAFQVEPALAALERARAAGPHPRTRLVRLYEQLGIAHSYLGHEREALAAFAMLLAIDPGHLISYVISPKATFLFERERVAAEARPAPEIQISWPQGLRVARPVPIDVEVVADPRRFLARAAVHVRRRGERAYQAADLALPAPGARRTLWLPAVDAERAETIELWVAAYDREGNEVLRWSDPRRPREVPLAYVPPTPWYRTGWFIATAVVTVAVAAGVTAYLVADEPADTLGGRFSF